VVADLIPGCTCGDSAAGSGDSPTGTGNSSTGGVAGSGGSGVCSPAQSTGGGTWGIFFCAAVGDCQGLRGSAWPTQSECEGSVCQECEATDGPSLEAISGCADGRCETLIPCLLDAGSFGLSSDCEGAVLSLATLALDAGAGP
jgi:hypothetical protein